MHPILFHIPEQLGGVPIIGWGVLAAIWAVASAAALAWTYWRAGGASEALGLAPVLLLIGAVVVWIMPALSDGIGVPIRGYGAMMVLAVGAGCWLITRQARRMGVDPEIMLSLTFWVFGSGIVGGRLFYVLQKWDQFHRATTLPGTLLEIVNLAEGGLVVYGGVIGGAIALLTFVHVYRLPLLAVCDLAAAPAVLGLAFGRIGCFFTGCCFGATCALPWAISFPPGSPPHIEQIQRGEGYWYGVRFDPAKERAVVQEVQQESPAAAAGLSPGDVVVAVNGISVDAARGAYDVMARIPPGESLQLVVAGHDAPLAWTTRTSAGSLPVHPTQIYSAINAAVICLFLVVYYPFRSRDGEVIALLLTIYPVTRFLLEMIRTDEKAVGGTGLSISQNVSILILFNAAALWVYLLRQPRGSVLPTRGALKSV